MWSISKVEGVPSDSVFLTDGQPIKARRGPAGSSYRMIVVGRGFLDITDTGHQPGGPHYWQLNISGATYWYDGEGAPTIRIQPDGVVFITGNGNDVSTALAPLPGISASDVPVVQAMEQKGLIPYSQLRPHHRPFSDVARLAAQYFPFTTYARTLALSLYDWTTADFFRMDMLHLYRYTALAGAPLDDADIVKGIWTADWPPYSHTDEAFMHSLMMTPCSTEEEVAEQFAKVRNVLPSMLTSLEHVTTAALTSMQRTSVLSKPALFSGQVAISNLSEEAFAVYFNEYPGNAGPVGHAMGMPLADALAGFMAPGNTVHLKSFMSFTDSEQDAAHYSNGILVEVAPVPRSAVWAQCAYITSLSDEAGKIEYLFPPGSGFVVDSFGKKTISGKEVAAISMTEAPTP
ncbi:MAG: hypothetical protein PVI86_13390 [Phycisphaerae bacterium]|jgi:hypothetical protein